MNLQAIRRVMDIPRDHDDPTEDADIKAFIKAFGVEYIMGYDDHHTTSAEELR